MTRKTKGFAISTGRRALVAALAVVGIAGIALLVQVATGAGSTNSGSLAARAAAVPIEGSEPGIYAPRLEPPGPPRGR